MYAASKSIGLKKGDAVLTPVFDCDGTLTPFRALGLTLEFYKSDPYTFEVDIEDIKRRITKDVKLLHVINHFGMPQPWDSLLELRKETGIPILEDNAFSLFSEYKGELFGTFGDFSIFSLYKMLPLIHGGMLRVNNPEISLKLPPRTQKWFYPPDRKSVMGLIASKMGYRHLPEVFKKKISPTRIPFPPLYSDKPGYPEWHLRDEILYPFSYDYYRPMSKIAQIQLRQFAANHYSGVRDKIKRYYEFIVESLKDVKGLKILWKEVAKETVPSCVTVLIDSHRDDFLYRLKAKKYAVSAWPTFSGDVIDRTDEFPEIEIIGRKILQLMIPAHRVVKIDANYYFESLVAEVINCNNIFQPE